MELMPVKDRPRVIHRFSLPQGDYTTWDAKQAFEAELLAKLFANTYIRDFSPANAMLRLGARDLEHAHVSGTVIANHWLTQHYIRGLIDSFGDTGIVSAHSVSALLWRDASDFSPGANPMARVNAQKCLATALGMTEAQNRRKEKSDIENIRGGVIWVDVQANTLPDWEAVAIEKQAIMMARLEDDSIVEAEEVTSTILEGMDLL